MVAVVACLNSLSLVRRSKKRPTFDIIAAAAMFVGRRRRPFCLVLCPTDSN